MMEPEKKEEDSSASESSSSTALISLKRPKNVGEVIKQSNKRSKVAVKAGVQRKPSAAELTLGTPSDDDINEDDATLEKNESDSTKEQFLSRPYACNVCNKSFANKSTLSTHTRIHTGNSISFMTNFSLGY